MAQGQQYAFRIYFKDKNNTSYDLNNPSAFLSQRSIDRRIKFNIPIDSSDLPVNESYVSTILQSTNGAIRVNSRWHNTMVLIVSDTSTIQGLNQFPFFKSSKLVAVFDQNNPLRNPNNERPTSVPGDEDYYGNAWQQLNLCNGDYLHEKGFMGNGLRIAVIDVGFKGLETVAAFDSLRNQNRIIDFWNYTKNNTDYAYTDHGTKVLSCMAANLPDEFVGTAPNAEYVLYITDDYDTEQTIEEDYWTAAAEKADSLGVDLISSSLGYNYFDQNENSYTYQDLDGKTTYLAQTSNAAVRKGIMTVNSAGNEGNSSWHYILTPGDADSALTIGSVNQLKNPAMSSGWGPNAANKRKPEVVGLGQGAGIIDEYGNSTTGNGTSYATPIIAGLTACLMQARPDLKPLEIKDYICSVSDHFLNPDDKIGFGVPDFKLALDLVTSVAEPKIQDKQVLVFPNPSKEVLFLQLKSDLKPLSIAITDISGKTIYPSSVTYQNAGLLKINTSDLLSGIYFLNIQFKDFVFREKFVH